MRMTLTYRGPLPPLQKGVSRVKADLRRAFHPQIHDQLQRRLTAGVKMLATTEFGGHHFVSPAHQRLGTVVNLDVLLLTPAALRSPIGDLDNRLKTLIDGLTRPANMQQMEEFQSPEDGGPTFCLMDDDKLVHQLSVDYRPWHEPTAGSQDTLVVVTAVLSLGHAFTTSSPVAIATLVL